MRCRRTQKHHHTRLRFPLAVILLAGWLGLALSASAALDPTRDKILHIVSTAHLDTQWNWTIQDTINVCIPGTLTNNFDFSWVLAGMLLTAVWLRNKTEGAEPGLGNRQTLNANQQSL